MKQMLHPFFLRFWIALAFALLHTSAYAQRFKVYYDHLRFPAPLHLSARELAPYMDGQEIALLGEVKEPSPNFASQAFVLKLNLLGAETGHFSYQSMFNTSTNGLYAAGLATDNNGNLYIGGAAIQNGSVGAGSERVITSLARDGRQRWSQMQPNYAFESVAIDDDGNLLGISGPYGNSLPNTQIMISRYDSEGNFIQAATVSTYTSDQPVKIITLPAGRGFLALGNLDTAGQTRPFVMQLDNDMNPVWANQYELFRSGFQARDIAWSSNGLIGVTGDVATGSGSKPFLLILDARGEVQAYQSYEWRDIGTGRATAIAPAVGISGAFDGFVIGGDYGSASERRTFISSHNRNGDINWAQTYSVFSAAEYTYSETVSDLLYLPSERAFIATGDFTRFRNGGVNHRAVWVARADIANGETASQGESCSEELRMRALAGIVRAADGVTLDPGGSSFGISFVPGDLWFDPLYCSYDETRREQGEEEGRPAPGIRIPSEMIGQTLEAEVFDISGRVIWAGAFVAENESFKTPSTLAAGVYAIRIMQDGEQVAKGRVAVLK
ncbi:MAG: T9SS C-terminal target domain-containing protein [Bacteroidetes bacterium]|nr:MAG: T9SS C-terminal target domain-containing protein [Bacteroidota bacterium]